MQIKWAKDHCGRAAAGFRGQARDGVVRSIAIITGRPYRDLYDKINEAAKREEQLTTGKGQQLQK